MPLLLPSVAVGGIEESLEYGIVVVGNESARYIYLVAYRMVVRLVALALGVAVVGLYVEIERCCRCGIGSGDGERHFVASVGRKCSAVGLRIYLRGGKNVVGGGGAIEGICPARAYGSAFACVAYGCLHGKGGEGFHAFGCRDLRHREVSLFLRSKGADGARYVVARSVRRDLPCVGGIGHAVEGVAVRSGMIDHGFFLATLHREVVALRCKGVEIGP